jgi:hypothetical protein
MTACGGGGHAASGSSATVFGTVRGYGGPAILVHGKPREAIDGKGLSGQVVTARRADGDVVRARTDPRGRYAIALPPGRYTIQSTCSAPVSVSVVSAQRLRVPLQCDFP